jgi:hypothetical protein
MFKGRTYGKKKGLASSRAAVIFGESSTADRKPLGDITNGLNTLKLDESNDSDATTMYPSDSETEIRFAHHGFRNTVATVPEPRRYTHPTRFGGDGAQSIRSVDSEVSQLTELGAKLALNEEPLESTTSGEEDVESDTTLKDVIEDCADDLTLETEDPLSLSPLFAAIKKDALGPLGFHDWGDVIVEDSCIQVEKIAEASFAEVYRVKSPAGNSNIVKVMRIKVAAEEGCENYEGFTIANDMVSELRIINSLVPVPGFVRFSRAYVVKGHPCTQLVDAYDAYSASHGGHSEHMDPRQYTDESTFLIVELADAGFVLEDIEITNINEVWDVMVGVTMALARAELDREFEVCIPCTSNPNVFLLTIPVAS